MENQKVVHIKKGKKGAHNKKGIIKTVIFTIVIILVISVIYSYKNYPFMDGFINNLKKSNTTNEPSEFTYSITSQYKSNIYKNDIIFFSKEGLKCTDKKGKEQWLLDIKFENPIIQSNDKYILIANKGGKEVNIISNNSIICTVQTEETIISAKVNNSNYFVIVTNAKGYKGKITVYDLKGQEIYKWYSGENYIVDMDISEDGKRLAVCTLDTSLGKVSGGIVFFYLNQEKPYAGNTIENTIISNVKFYKDNSLIVIGDTQILCFSQAGVQDWSMDYQGKTLQSFDINSEQFIVLALSMPKEENILMKETAIEVLNDKGKKVCTYPVNGDVKTINIQDDLIAFNNKRDIYIINTKGSNIFDTTYNKDIMDIILFKNKRDILIASRNSLEIMNFK